MTILNSVGSREIRRVLFQMLENSVIKIRITSSFSLKFKYLNSSKILIVIHGWTSKWSKWQWRTRDFGTFLYNFINECLRDTVSGSTGNIQMVWAPFTHVTLIFFTQTVTEFERLFSRCKVIIPILNIVSEALTSAVSTSAFPTLSFSVSFWYIRIFFVDYLLKNDNPIYVVFHFMQMLVSRCWLCP